MAKATSLSQLQRKLKQATRAAEAAEVAYDRLEAAWESKVEAAQDKVDDLWDKVTDIEEQIARINSEPHIQAFKLVIKAMPTLKAASPNKDLHAALAIVRKYLAECIKSV